MPKISTVPTHPSREAHTLPTLPEDQPACKRMRYADYQKLGHIPRTMNFQDLRQVEADAQKSTQSIFWKNK